MKTKNALCSLPMAVVLHFGVLAASAQTNIYLYSGSETNITLNPGTYIITAYGAMGGRSYGVSGGIGAEMSAEFNFSSPTDLTLLVGGGGGDGSELPYFTDDGGSEAGGGGGSFVVEGSTPLVVAGGGGGAVANLSVGAVAGGNASVSTYGGAGGGSAGGSGGNSGNGGGGGDGGSPFGGFSSGIGAGGGGGFYGDGGSGIPSTGGGGLCFESGGTGGYGNSGYGADDGGFGGGGGGSAGDSLGFPNDLFGGGGGGYSGGGGGGEEFHNGECDAGGGGGSFIDSSAIAILAEVAGAVRSGIPARVYNGEIIIVAAPLAIITANAAFGFTNGVFGFDVTGPSGATVVIQASTDLQTWIPLQTSLLGSGPLYFSDPQWTNYPARFYRAAGAYTVGGSLTGLPAGDTVTLQDNGGDDLTLSTNGTFTFPTALPDGQSYSVTVSGTSGGTRTFCTLINGSGTISSANVTNVAVQCTPAPPLTGNLDVDMYNAAVADGTANGGVPGVMLTENGGPFRVTAEGRYSDNVCEIYSGSCVFTHVVGTYSCSSTTFPTNVYVIQFGSVLECGFGPYHY